uniref:VWFD domain-containing protein n=1 Tax=Peromyscus maniculatus bairdii TaxID=230844 RepID=A0A8C8T4P2_PERMB
MDLPPLPPALQCPDHSHYSVCMSSCQGSCAALSGLTQCTTRCFEGCECDNHYLLSQGVCIPAHDCGCTYNGQYMPVSRDSKQEVGAEEMEGHSELLCSGGKARCVAESTAVCRAQGDPHYTTFDGRRYDMMGTCSYTMAELHSTKKSLLAFKVEAKNEHRGTNKVSYVRFVTVRAYNHTVSLAYGEIGIAQGVSGVDLPASLSDGRLRVYQSGTQGVVELDFGLVVTYDWDCQLTLSLPKRFQDQVSGLCGNYNGDPADDFRMPDGKQASDVLNFTKSWKLDNGDLLCDDGCFGNCPSCTTSQTQFFKGDCLCGILTLSTGPFADCHDFLDPKPFLEECVYDMCVTRGERLTLCHGLSAYARACADLGISVREWRSRTNCSMSCPANSYYDLCSPACPASCNSEAAPANCSRRPCVEGCVCLPGFVSNRGLCVPVSSCGCTFQGRLLAPGQEVFADDLCRQRCTCDAATQKVICRDTSGCLSGERCGIQNGFLGCYPEYFGSCRASGDPHYMTFDRRNYNFMGTCTYMLTTSCGQHPSLPDFKVIMENERRGSQSVSFVHSVQLEVYGVKLEVPRNYPGKVLVSLDGVIRYLPFQAAGGKIVAFRRGMYAVLRTNFGLTLSFNWDTHVTAKVPSSYAKAVCGLCGNFNGEPRDDLGQQDKGEALDPRDFGKKWMVTEKPGCRTDEQLRCPHMNSKSVVKNKEKCKILRDKEGQFRHCWKVPMFNSALIECAYDSCRMPGQTKPLCDALATYTAICQAEGITVYPWRSEKLCPMNCPPHSHYELCHRGCPLTCGDLPVPGGCGSHCQEACVCDEGFVLSGETCVPLSSCGCVYQGVYHQAEEDFYPGPECNSLCHCHKGGLVSCQPSYCSPYEVCKVSSGVLRCVAVNSATCRVSGASHYTTFDGRRFDFIGTCVYVLVQTCWTRPGLQQFTILQENAVSGNNTEVSVTKMITIQVANYTLKLQQNQWKVTVNGVNMKMPVVLDGGSVQALQHGVDVVIKTRFGLQVSYDLNNNVRVTVPRNYYNYLCGLCGDYNDDPKNDLQKSDGSQAVSPSELGNSWAKAVPGSFCMPQPACKPGQDCQAKCSPAMEKKYHGVQFCGLLSSPTGPLAACHKLLDPQDLFKDCVFDLCLNGGNLSILCNHIHNYVSICQAAGGHVKPWRNKTFCPLQCPANSHYQLCGDSCPVSCPSLLPPEGCETTCREGCVCDSGFVLSGDTCVPVGQCGCLHNGRYYLLGATFYPGPECERLCGCGPGGQVSCQIESCGIHEECQIVDGIHACHPKSFKSVLVLNGIHYVTLDGRVYDLYGSCSYVLAQVCYPKPGLKEFSIVLEKNLAGEPQRVVVTVDGQDVVLAKGPQVTVESEAVTLPVVIGSMYVTVEGRNMFLQTKWGLKLLFDGDAHILMVIPSPFYGRICGLCGNFNGNQSDDFVLPSGTLAPNVEAFGAAWRAPGSSLGCGEGCGPQGCPVCLAEKREAYEKNEACGQISNPQGPFKDCHQVLSPLEYFRQCVFNMCAHKRKQVYLCRSLAAYTAACQAVGATVKPWRTDSFCRECLWAPRGTS